MKTAVRTPTNAVTAKATVGRGVVSPKFSRSPFPVAISTLIATANPTMASRPSHTSKLLLSWVLCSHLIGNGVALRAVFLWQEVLRNTRGEPVAKAVLLVRAKLERGRREGVGEEVIAHTSLMERGREAETWATAISCSDRERESEVGFCIWETKVEDRKSVV